MKRPTDIVIRRVLKEIASTQEAAEVAAWFATEAGQKWLSEQMDADAEDIAKGNIPLLNDIPTEELLRRIDRVINRANRRRTLFRVAALLIPCALVLGMWLNLNSRLGGALFSSSAIAQVTAAGGERKEVIFQDGSKVWLNAGTSITYPEHFGLAERRVTLDGEAYFEVRPNAKRPFVVKIGDAAIQVLGTSFNVKAYADEALVDILLIEGSVEFAHHEETYTLQPAQKLIYNRTTGDVELQTTEMAGRETLWRQNIISFRDASLQEVIRTLERWYDVKFEVIDEEVYRCTFSLQTPHLPLAELLNEIQKIAAVKFQTENDIIRVSTKK